ncbi:MAG: tRNA cyclic N6-threonylcarbamoyladenosine(37) synthase TcdA [Candidatus Epulonipiscioides saccharophilum]|nr:MAG: tRNA cyclic N6-threonylcarbamoyladenosine(37) synthase TcdA [Epulopiscium sp. AS2M-Bin001]
MNDIFSRTQMLIGEDGLNLLKQKTVAVFGIGGVGSYSVEALARSGIGKLILIDNDEIAPSNINRQIHANIKTVGQPKVEAMKNRILDINPELQVLIHQKLYNTNTSAELLLDSYDYVIDAIDMVSAKIDLIERCTSRNINIISAMGAGNKLDPSQLKITDIFKTSVCPLAKVMRHELRKRGVKKLDVVYSTELPIKPLESSNGETKGRQTPGSIAFVPAVSGLMIASVVIRNLLNIKVNSKFPS